jgi:CDP-diacylglycerol--serine O-phosphatidyltransferase
MSIKKHIPNAITCCNLLCGCLAIVQAFEGNLVYAAYLVGLAAVFDFFDGFAARMLRVASPIGKDLDSLADMVTFGVVPGIVMSRLLQHKLMDDIYKAAGDVKGSGFAKISIEAFNTAGLISYLPFIIIIFSAIRLAKFNNDTRQTSSFIGLPTPANAILICSFPLILSFGNSNLANDVIQNPYFLIIISVVLSVFLITEIPLFALKFRTFSWNGNRTRYIFLILSVVLLVLFRFTGIPLVILLYVIMSINSNYFAKRRERH